MADGDDEEEGGEAGFVNLHVSSSCFSSMAYNPKSEQLMMTFAKDGRSYVIDGISEADVDAWTRSISIGGHFNSFIRGNY